MPRLYRPFTLLLIGSVLSAGPRSEWKPRPETHPNGPVGTRLEALRPAPLHFVMGPLELLTDWDAFRRQLKSLSELGIDGVTTDVWWGRVEPKRGQFDWSYYLKYAQLVKEAGLKWVPILSFHAAGGNVGDNVDEPLPPWVWDIAPDMRFISASGNISREYISFWVPDAYDLYESVMRSFAANFGPFREIIQKIYLSGGPAGEFRFPSYVPAFGWKYPGIGELQLYSHRAVVGFRSWLKRKYGAAEGISKAWGFPVELNDIWPPGDGEQFFRDGVNTVYGRDLLQYQQQVLEEHLFNILLERGAISFGVEAAPKPRLGSAIGTALWGGTQHETYRVSFISSSSLSSFTPSSRALSSLLPASAPTTR
ncbi:MAG: family 14 glycosylhydrolase [Deltaproteobacteria bacterium]|nr:family 14 glycosylhydrolase [Deltaproteobacteria bacterium]MBI3294627.1 family 14 glycosylhydrolase [Deltaproteobacteria bacterium]